VANNTAALVRNSCYANKTDLRSYVDGDQIISHYAVYTFGFDNDPVSGHAGNNANRQGNKTILEEATRAGGGNKEGRDQFYDASVEGTTLQEALNSAITDILTRAASGTSVSVLSTSSRGVGSMVQAYFLPERKEGTREVAWTGYLQNIWVDPQDNLRDDSGGPAPPDYKLMLDSAGSSDGDAVMKLYFNSTTNQTEAGLFTTFADGSGGSLSACSDPPRKAFDMITTLWEAGRKLATTDPDSRTIYTSTRVIRETSSGTVDLFDRLAPGDLFTLSSLIEEQEAALNIPASGATSGDPSAFNRANIVDYIRGKDLEATHPEDFRDRRVTLDGSNKPEVWKLGDIMGSTPKVISNMPLNSYQRIYNDTTYYRYTSSSAYRERSSLALVGANDGMLHAFRVGYLKDDNLQGGIKAVFHALSSEDQDPSGTSRLGEEVWAYVPLNAFPYLKYLAHKNYGSCHMYYNDLSVKVLDVSTGGHADEPKAADGSSWETILIGGMRFGGACAGPGAEPSGPPTGTPADVGYSSYFALNITDLENPVPLWEFSDEDMGYSTSLPAIVRTGEGDTNGYWYVVFGSGSTVLAKSTTDVGRTTTGHVYFLDLRTGDLEQKIPLDHHAIVGDVLAVDNDFDFHSEKVYFGTSYRDADAGAWKGKLMSVALPNQDLGRDSWAPSSPGYTVLFEGNYPFTASPEATKDEAGTVWVYAGSGKYYSDLDEEDRSQQIFIGLKDDGGAVSYPVREGDTAPVSCDDPPSCPSGSLCDTTNCTTTGTVTATIDVCDYDKMDNTFKKKTIVTAVDSTSTAPVPETGWKTYLAQGERVISRPLAVGGLIDFLTYIPSTDACAFGGDAFLYSLGYVSGVAPEIVAIRAPGATSGTSGTVTIQKAVPLGPGAPPTGDAIIIPPQKEGREQLKKKIQVGTGVVVETENKPVISTTSKIILWLKK
ncbi:MAG TPA: hypothetical protein DCO77_01090, partial [Nitrospiraceae bacterium]|nr:hypothetical protein [Nitrospiraceae bacterium]